MRASFETLCTVTSVEEERFALLDLGELILQTFDLPKAFQPDSGGFFFDRQLASEGATSGGRVAIFDNTLAIFIQQPYGVIQMDPLTFGDVLHLRT
jgi:hypothetical protein